MSRQESYDCPDPWCDRGRLPSVDSGWVRCTPCDGNGRIEGEGAALRWVQARAGMEHSESLMERWQGPLAEWQARELPCEDKARQVLRLALGVSEEAGEVARCVLKADQQIRGGAEAWRARLGGEIGDVVVYLLQLASVEGLDFEECVEGAVSKVLARRFATSPPSPPVELFGACADGFELADELHPDTPAADERWVGKRVIWRHPIGDSTGVVLRTEQRDAGLFCFVLDDAGHEWGAIAGLLEVVR